MPSKPNGVWIDADFVLIADAGNAPAGRGKAASTTVLSRTGMPNSHLYVAAARGTPPQLLLRLEEADMNDLYAWFSRQHHGLRAFRNFQQKLDSLSRDEPEHRGLYRLLSNLVGSYIETFDEEPLPVAVADRAYERLLELLAGLDPQANPARRLADINRVAASNLLH
jgi:hypothetical protein